MLNFRSLPMLLFLFFLFSFLLFATLKIVTYIFMYYIKLRTPKNDRKPPIQTYNIWLLGPVVIVWRRKRKGPTRSMCADFFFASLHILFSVSFFVQYCIHICICFISFIFQRRNICHLKYIPLIIYFIQASWYRAHDDRTHILYICNAIRSVCARVCMFIWFIKKC